MPPALSVDTVRRVAALARLQVSDAECVRFADQLGAILDYAQQVAGVDTSHVDPTSHVFLDRLPERADEPGPCLPKGAAFDQAPAVDLSGRLFIVPRVIGG